MVFPLRQLTKIQTTTARRCSRYYHSISQTYTNGALKNSTAIMQFHSQTQNDQTHAVLAEKNANHGILPPNLTFDLKSSFAPSKKPKRLKLMDKNKNKKKNKLPPPPPTASSSSLHQQEDLENADNNNDGNNDKIINNGKEIENEHEFGSDEHDDDEDDIDIDNAIDTLSSSFQQHQLRPVLPLPERLHIQILDGPTGKGGAAVEDDDELGSSSSGSVGSIWLESTVFGLDPIRIDLIKQAVDYIRNKIRGVRTAKSKTISEVSGSGRKVRPQKGGGQARAGHSRPAHWRGGAKAHGPKNTVDYGNCKLNKNVKKIAIRSLLSQKLKEGNLIIVNHLMLESHKTGPWAKILEQNYGIGKTTKKKNSEIKTTTALIVDHYLEPEKEEDSDIESTNSSSSEKSDYHASYHGVPINLWVATSNIPRVLVRNTRFLNVYDILKKEKLIITLSALNEIENKWKTQ